MSVVRPSVNCPGCQTPSAPGARFCSRCGTKIARPCASCQHENPPGVHYCEHCGRAPDAASPGDRRLVTLLFADVQGFSAMSEQLDPATVTSLVNRCFTVLTRPIYRHGGVVDQYLGDAIMALFGAPVSHEDDPERAVAAAWEMRAAASEFARNLEAKTGIRLKVRIGLHTGLVVAGAAGAEQQRDTTVLGEAVHVVSQLEAHARPGSVLVSEETCRLTRHAWEYLELEPVRLKGSDRAVRVYEPAGMRTGVEEREGMPFVGRELELLTLEGELDQALMGSGRAVVLTGAAGLGKSRLVRTFARRKEERGLHVLEGWAHSDRQEVPYALVASMLAGWMGLAEREVDPPHLEDWCARHELPQPERIAELLGYFLGLPLRAPEFVALASEALKRLAWQTLHELVLARGARGRILLVHDVQWLDEASAAWLRELVRLAQEPGSVPLLVVAVARSGAEDRLGLEVETRRLQLSPLADEEAEQLVMAMLELAEPPEGELALLLARTRARAEGNPLFLGELVRMLIASQVLGRDARGWKVQDAQGLEALPATLEDLLASRLDRLAPGARQVAQVAAVLGRDFPVSLLAEAAQAEAIGEALTELVDSELIHHRARQPGTYAFHEALVQEALYHGIRSKARRELHRRVGLLLEERAAYQTTEAAPMLAYHFRRAEDVPRAIRYLFLAGRHAQGRFDNHSALSNFHEALELLEQTQCPPASPDRPTLLAAIAEVEATLGRYVEALEHLDQALALATSGRERATLLRQMGGVYERLGTYERAIASYEDALTMLEPGAVVQRAGLLGALAHAEYGLGRCEPALSRLAAAMPDLEDAVAKVDLAFCHSVMGLILTRQGHLRQALEQHEAALALRTELGDVAGMGASLHNLSQVHFELGEIEAAAATLEEAIAAFARVGDQGLLALAHHHMALMLQERGELRAAEARLRTAVQLARRIGLDARLGPMLIDLGELLALQDRGEEALAQLTEGVGRLEELQHREALPQAYRILATVQVELGQSREAWAVVVKAMKLNRIMRDEAEQGILYSLAGAVFTQAGQHASAMAWLSKAIALLPPRRQPLELARAWQRLAAALFQGGQPTHAAAAALKARQAFRELGATRDQARLEAWLREVSPGPSRRVPAPEPRR